MLDLLNQLLADYVYEDIAEVDFQFLTTLSKIIRKQRIFLQPQKYHTRMGLQKSYQLSYDFLTKISPSYGEYLENCKNSGNLLVHRLKKRRPEHLSAMTVSEAGKQIDIYPTGTVEDTYTFSHEIMHSWNCDEKELTPTWSLVTECLSILVESLQEDDFAKQGICPPEYRKNKIDTYYALRQKAIRLDFEIQLLETFQAYGYLDIDSLARILKKMDDEERTIAFEHLDWIERKETLEIWDLQRYVISGLLASHMHQRILKRPAFIQEFFTLTNHLNEMDFVDVLAYLDLEVLDEDTCELSQESYKLLEKSYQAELYSL